METYSRLYSNIVKKGRNAYNLGQRGLLVCLFSLLVRLETLISIRKDEGYCFGKTATASGSFCLQKL